MPATCIRFIYVTVACFWYREKTAFVDVLMQQIWSAQARQYMKQNMDKFFCSIQYRSEVTILVTATYLWHAKQQLLSPKSKKLGWENLVWRSGLCDWCRGCMQMHGAVSVLVRGTVKSLKWRLVFTKDQYSAHCSSSLCLKPYHESSALGSPGRTSMPMTLLSSLNHLRNVSGG